MNIKTSIQNQELQELSATPARIKLYEELEGGEGREIFFRPHRYEVSQFEPLSLWVQLTGKGDEIDELSVLDLSQGGVALRWVSSGLPEKGEELILTVGFDEQLAYVGRAVVSVVRELESDLMELSAREGESLTEAHVGLDLKDGLLKIDELLQTRDLKRQHSANAPFGAHASSWRAVGHEGFKARVAEMSLLLDDWSAHFSKIEQQVSWDLLRAEAAHPTRAALLQLVKADFMPDFLSLAGRLYEDTRALSVKEQAPLKSFSQRFLDERFMSAPWMYRARVKPLGYPGDYEVMNHIYREELEGRTLLGQALNYSTLQSPAATAVRNRKDILKAQLMSLCCGPESDQPARILSVAAGPAQETFELLSEATSLSRPVEIVLFDQDPAALAFAYGRLKRVVDQRFEGQVKLVYLHDSIRRLLDDQALFEGFGHFDMIMCSGLYDYLRHSTAVKLTEQMTQRCREGGRVFIGNMTPDNPSRWIMEHHLEWSLLYRTHKEILSFAQEGAPQAEKWELITETTGVNPFVCIQR